MEEQLLNLVSEHPELYNKSCAEYKSLLKKEAAWTKISANLKITVPEAKSKFKSLREKYQREKKLHDVATRSGSKASCRPEWNLFKYFQFLEDSTIPRSTLSNAENTERENTQLTEDSDIIFEVEELEHHESNNLKSQDSCDLVAESSSSSVTPNSVAIAKKRKKQRYSNDEDDPTLSILQSIGNSINAVADNKRASNKYENFTNYLLGELRELPEEDADEFIDGITGDLLRLKRKLREARKT